MNKSTGSAIRKIAQDKPLDSQIPSYFPEDSLRFSESPVFMRFDDKDFSSREKFPIDSLTQGIGTIRHFNPF